jgi:copper chaperone
VTVADSVHVVLNVPGISCNHCKMAIEGAVAALDGVESVVVDVAGTSVDVVFDGARLERERIEAAIAAEGYEVAGGHVFDG